MPVAEDDRSGKSIWDRPELREELAYCVPLGIPHSTFLTWDDDDQDKALAYLREMRKVCPSCGTREEEWGEGGRTLAYITNPVRCHGCKAIDQEKENIPEGEHSGVFIQLVPFAAAVAMGLADPLEEV